MCAAKRGATLTEVLVASSIALVVILAVGTTDVSRVHREQALREQAGVASSREEAALASLYLPNLLMQADRINIVSPTIIQVRRLRPEAADRFDADPVDGNPNCPSEPRGGSCITAGALPPECCFRIAANYRWDQYQLNGEALEWYGDTWDATVSPGAQRCGSYRVLSNQITSLTFRYKDTTAATLGDEPWDPSTEDNNVVEYDLTWQDTSGNDRTYHATVASQAFPYADLGAAAGDSGRGLDRLDVSPPPPLCPP